MRLLLGALALIAAGCGPDFDPPSYLDPAKLRVLGVVADPPEVAPGQTSMLKVIVAASSPVTYDWALCTQPPPPGSASVDELCVQSDMGDFLIPIDATGDTAQVTMPADTTPARLGVPDASGGFYVPIRIRARTDTDHVDAVYGLRLALAPLPPNHNPTIDSATLVGEPLDASPMLVSDLSQDPAQPTPVAARSQPTFRLTLTDDSYESYPTITGTPPNTMIVMTTEQPRFFWFADAGQFTQDTTGQEQPDTKLKLDDDKHHAPHVGDPIRLFVVVHDDRGGTAFTERFLVVQ